MGNNGSNPIKYDDDEPIIVAIGPNQDESGEDTVGVSFDLGKVQMNFENEPRVPPEETNYKLLIELKGRGTGSERPGVDIVMVLDVSQSMVGEKLKEMKRAMQFVINKLSPLDRLSIVSFSSDSDRKFPMRPMTLEAQQETDFLIQNLTANGSPNISSGLVTGLKVLEDRKYTDGRSGAIMLVSDSIQIANKNSVGQFPVFSFSVGTDGVYDSAQVKNNDISKHIKGGDLSPVFSKCLGELLSVHLQDFQLVLKPLKAYKNEKETVTTKINKVYAGNFPVTIDDTTGNVTVSFGDLYQNETRTVLADLFLPKVPDEKDIDLDTIKVACTYRSNVSGNLTSANPYVFRVTRSSTRATEQSDEAMAEITRLEVVELMNEARNLADKNLEEAINKAVEAQDLLAYLYLKKPIPIIETLKFKVNEMVKYLQTEDNSFTFASKTSNPHQHTASRGNVVGKMRCYALPSMDTTSPRLRLTLPKATRKLSIKRPELMFGSHLPRASASVSFKTNATVNVLSLAA